MRTCLYPFLKKLKKASNLNKVEKIDSLSKHKNALLPLGKKGDNLIKKDAKKRILCVKDK